MARNYQFNDNDQLNPPGAVTRVEGETVHVLVTVDDVVLDVVEEVLAAVVAAHLFTLI